MSANPADKKSLTDDSARLLKAVDNADIDRRLATLEKSFEKLEANHLQRHTQTITWIFAITALLVSGVTICVTVLGFLSRSENQESTRQMETRVREATTAMDGKFEHQQGEIRSQFAALAGEAMKKPMLEISIRNGLLEGQKLELPQGQITLPFFPLFIKNIGDKKSDALSVRLFTAEGLTYQNDEAQLIPSKDAEYPVCYYFHSRGIVDSGISAGETRTIESDWSQLSISTNSLNCKIQIFYGSERPSEAHFLIIKK